MEGTRKSQILWLLCLYWPMLPVTAHLVRLGGTKQVFRQGTFIRSSAWARLPSGLSKKVGKREFSVYLGHHEPNVTEVWGNSLRKIFNDLSYKWSNNVGIIIDNLGLDLGRDSSSWNGVMQCSTMRKRRAKMNKHKLKKRRKRIRMNTKQTRN